MAVKEYQQKETSPSTSAAEKKVIQSNTKRERWSAKQTDALVKLWKENFFLLATPKWATVWQKVKVEINKHGPEKTVTQCKNKIRNLKAAYKATKENNKKSGASPEFCQYFNGFDEVLQTRDVINLTHIAEVGVEREEVDFEEESHQHCEIEIKFISNVHVPVSACIVLLDFLERRVFGR